MEKEEILNSHIKNASNDNEFWEDFCNESIYPAMDEYAKQEAIGFTEWMVKRKVSPIGGNHWEDWGREDQENQIVPMTTTEQLYTIYKNQKQ